MSKEAEEAKIRARQIKEIEKLAGLPYDEIEVIFKTAKECYQTFDRSLDGIIYDLTHGGYTAIPF